MLKKTRTPLTADEIKKMRVVGKMAARTLEHTGRLLRAGMSTKDIDTIVAEHTASTGGQCATLGYHGFPASCCTSINNVVCHGVPRADVILRDGDIVNVDVTTVFDGFYGDCSATFLIGDVREKARDLVEAAMLARDKGIEVIKAGATTGDIGFVIDKFTTRRGYTTVKEIGGHGIGRVFHDEPFVPSYGKRGRGDLLRAGFCITVEPMVNEGSAAFDEIEIPGSTHKEYITADGKLSAQFEHTVLITETGYEILTLPD